MPNPPKPIEQKRRTGNPGKRPLPSVGSLAAVPAVSPADWERPLAEVFDTLLEEGVHWIAKTDAPLLAACRDAVDFLNQLRGDPRSKPADVTAQFKAVVSMMSELGFSPSSRARLGLAEVKAASKLEEIRARQAKH